MKFSVLLPTRNRLELLKYAVQSVFDQDYQNWEIVVSDNASEEDVAGYVQSLCDERVKYIRSDTLLPVTDNWNCALDASSGEYFIMLGDDDCLLGGYLSVVAGLLREFEKPELIYTQAIQYAYPNVIPGISEGFTQFGYCEFLNGEDEPFFLSRNAAMSVVKKALCFKIAYSYNMQHSVVSRQAVNRLKENGPFFQSPYPDYYATNALLLTSKRVLVCPWPLVGIGISPKSFGYFYFNNRENEGVDFLRNVADPKILAGVEDKILPGTNMNTSWLLAMESLKKNFPDEIPVDIAYGRYRFMQLGEMLRGDSPYRAILQKLKPDVYALEWVFWNLMVAVDWLGCALLPTRIWRRLRHILLSSLHRSHPENFDNRKRTVGYTNLLDLSRAESGIRVIPASWVERLKLEDQS